MKTPYRCPRPTPTFLTLLAIMAIATPFLSAGDFDPFRENSDTSMTDPQKSRLQGPVIPTIEFTNSDITMAFQIISDATGWSIFPTPEVSRAKVSLWAKKIRAGDLLDQIVTMSGFITHRRGSVISVMTYPEYMQYFGLSRTELQFDYADATSIAAVIKPFLTQLGQSVVHTQTNSLVLYDTDANLEQLKTIMKNLDQPSDQTIVEVVNLSYSDSEKMAKMLNQVFNPVKRKGSTQKSSPLASPTDASDSNPLPDQLKTSPPLPQMTLSFGTLEIYPAPQANQLILVGHKPDVANARELIAKIDIASDHMALEVIDITYADAEELAQTLQKLFPGQNSSKATSLSGNVSTTAERADGLSTDVLATNPIGDMQAPLVIHALGRSNQLIVKGFRRDLEKLRRLVEKLDLFIESTTKNYPFNYIDAAEIFPGLERVLNISRGGYRRSGKNSQNRHFGLTLLAQSNSIILTGPPSAHRILASTIATADVPAPFEAGIIRTYKLENADVGEVATIIRDLISNDENTQSTEQATFSKTASSPDDQDAPTSQPDQTHRLIQQVTGRVSVSNATNSVIVQTTARKHRELEQLIDELDKRRRQVLIEAFIVEVSTTDNTEIGIELAEFNSTALAFTSFGLSTINPATEARDIIVSPGGTAAVIDPDRLRAIIKALQSNSQVRIQSAPRLLVNDNATGIINSVAEEPVTQVNASTTVATTSFSGFVEAGTQFQVVPHISEQNYLRIQYQITLNNFGAGSSDSSIPPPRTTTSIQSEATVPNGFTVIVGGLQNVDHSERIDKVPFLGDIPLLGALFRSTATQKQYKTTYLFMTPSIMKEDNFSDLKQISRQSVEQAQIESPDELFPQPAGPPSPPNDLADQDDNAEY